MVSLHVHEAIDDLLNVRLRDPFVQAVRSRRSGTDRMYVALHCTALRVYVVCSTDVGWISGIWDA